MLKNKKDELISIIVPIYNVENYIEKCVETIVSQTYKNIEIILVDDGATDSCPKICDKWAKKDDRIKVIHKKNGGLSDARNAGLDMALGEYICFVDSDDYLDSRYVEILYNECKKNGVLVSQCGILSVNDEGEILQKMTYGSKRILSGRDMIIDYYGEHMVENVVVWNKLYHKSIFSDVRFAVGKIHEDEYITYKIQYSLEKIVVIPDELYLYRKNETSIVNKKFNIKRLDVIEAFEERIEFFKDKQDVVLYEKTLNKHIMLLFSLYCRTRKYVPNSKEIQKELLSKYRELKNEYLKLSSVTFIDKLKYIILYYLADIYYLFRKGKIN